MISFMDGSGSVTVIGSSGEWNKFVMALAERILEWGDESLLIAGRAHFAPREILQLADSVKTPA